MRRLSIGRSFRLALLALALALFALAAVGVALFYLARQDYESRLSSAYALEATAGRMLAAAVTEEVALEGRTGRLNAAAQARRRFDAAAQEARREARADPASAALVARAIEEQRDARAVPKTRDQPLVSRRAVERLVARQRERRVDARRAATHATRRALIGVGVLGVIAVAATLGAVGSLIAAVRRPLKEMADAAERLAGGELDVRVRPEAPGELTELAAAFNAMAEDLQRTTHALEDERRRLAITVESLGDALVVTGEDGRVETANPRAGELLPDAVPGAPLRDVAGLPDPVDALAGEVIVEHGRRTLAITASRLGLDRRGLVWTARDVGERLRLEQLKSEFVATASHELRSPLTSIKGFIELLNASEGLTDRQREWARIVLVSTNRLVELVNDLLDVARIEAGRAEIHRRPTDVGEAMREVADLLRPRLEERTQRLEVAGDTDLPLALADPARVRQILENLLTNAHLYTDDGGRVTVRGSATAHSVTFAVEDTGRGMSPEQLERVFDRFYRGNGGDGTRRGTGLGLSIVRALVDLHGGSIDVESTEGEGTTFTVRLPRAPAPDEDGGPRHALRGKRVLVLDDEADVVRLIARRLEPFGVEAVGAGTGDEALELLQRERFDAMTLDILMPGMSGFEVLRRLRSDQRLRELPVVVVSVFSGREALSGEWVVPKPIDADELADALGAAVIAGRVRVLAVGRPQARPAVSAALDTLGIEFAWASSADEAADLCARRRFEVALVDASVADPEAVLARLDLRGRRLRRSVLVFSSDGGSPGLARLDAEPIQLPDAGAALLALFADDAPEDRTH